MPEEKELSPQETGMCPHGNFKETCEVCIAESTEMTQEEPQEEPKDHHEKKQKSPRAKKKGGESRAAYFRKKRERLFEGRGGRSRTYSI